MRTFLLCLFALFLSAGDATPAPIYREVTLENEVVRVVLQDCRGNLRRFELIGGRAVALPKHLVHPESQPGPGDLSVLRSFQTSGAHNWLGDHDAQAGGLQASDTAPWQVQQADARHVTFTYDKPGSLQYELAYELHATRPTVSVRLSITNRQGAEIQLAPWFVPLNGVHQDLASADQGYCSAFIHTGGINGSIASHAMPHAGGGEDLAASDQGIDYLGLKSRFFAAWWTPTAMAAAPAAAPVAAPAVAPGPGPSAGPPAPNAPVAASLPTAGAWSAKVNGFTGKGGEQQAYISVAFTPAMVKPGETWSRSWSLSASSMTKADLARVDEIERRVEYTDGFYRFFKILAKGLVWVLTGIHAIVPIWGLAVIMLTVLVKAVLYRTTFKQQESMLKMQKIAPELKYVQEQYKNNKQMLAQKQMELFKKHGVNPLGGCLPLLIQIPIFIALFQAFSHSADLRGQGFLWIHDLTLPDQVVGWAVSWFPGGVVSLNPLPIIYIIVSIFMGLQQKPPANSDPTQESMYKMMRWLPAIFGVIFYQMPSGLVLYFTVQAVISMAEIKYIKHKLGMA